MPSVNPKVRMHTQDVIVLYLACFGHEPTLTLIALIHLLEIVWCKHPPGPLCKRALLSHFFTKLNLYGLNFM